MTAQLFDVRDKVVLITGGAAGIGRMIAAGFLGAGARVFITARDPEKARVAAAELGGGEDRCVGLSADLGTSDGPAALAAAFADHELRLDCLVNNAGVNDRKSLEMMDAASWDAVMDVNVRAPFLLVQQLLPALRAAAAERGDASVIGIGSIGGLHIPSWEAYPYGASKAALHHLTRALAKRLGPDRIRVNAIAPGPFPSPRIDVASEAVQKSIATYVPLGRAGTAEDIQGTCLFLAARAGAYVNGSTIALDGGYIAAL